MFYVVRLRSHWCCSPSETPYVKPNKWVDPTWQGHRAGRYRLGRRTGRARLGRWVHLTHLGCQAHQTCVGNRTR